MESARHLLPTEEHHCHKGGFHEESHYTLDGKRSSKDVAHKPRVVAPVGTKLKFEDDTRSHTHGEVNTEEFLPKLCSLFPKLLAGAIPASFYDAHDEGESQRQWDEEPVIDGGESELRPCPVYRRGVDV